MDGCAGNIGLSSTYFGGGDRGHSVGVWLSDLLERSFDLSLSNIAFVDFETHKTRDVWGHLY